MDNDVHARAVMEKIFRNTFVTLPAAGTGPDRAASAVTVVAPCASTDAADAPGAPTAVAALPGLPGALQRAEMRAPAAAPACPVGDYRINPNGLIERADFTRLYCATSLDADPARLGFVDAGQLKGRPPMIKGPCLVVWESLSSAMRPAHRQFGPGPYQLCSIDAIDVAGVSLNENLILNRKGLLRHWSGAIHGHLDEVHLSNQAVVPELIRVEQVVRPDTALDNLNVPEASPADEMPTLAVTDGRQRTDFSALRAHLRARHPFPPHARRAAPSHLPVSGKPCASQSASPPGLQAAGGLADRARDE